MEKKSIQLVGINQVKYKEFEEFRTKISSPRDVYKLVDLFLEDLDRECLIGIYVDTKNYVNSISIISVGTINSALVHPREVFKVAILSNAASLILAHNHPSGDPTPSKEDINITKRIEEAGNILGIKLLDHIIVGNKKISLKDLGIL